MPVAVPRRELVPQVPTDASIIAQVELSPDTASRNLRERRSRRNEDTGDDGFSEGLSGDDDEEDSSSSFDDLSDNEDDFDNDSNSESCSESDSIECEDPFNQNFAYLKDTSYGNGSCRHPSSVTRPCRYCRPKVSPVIFEGLMVIFNRLFLSSNLRKIRYRPLDSQLIVHFKSITAMHELGYSAKIINEVLNWAAFVLNRADQKYDQMVSQELTYLNAKVAKIFETVRSSGSFTETQLFQDFRNQLNSIGLTSMTNDENMRGSSNHFSVEYYR